MKCDPKVSIITPFKNASDFIKETAQSLVEQTHTNWEWILVNDHSSENEQLLIGDLLKDARVKLLYNKGSGIVDALVTAQNEATGEYLTRMDADDVMPANKLELFLQSLKQTNADIVTGKVQYFVQDGEVSNGYRKYQDWLNRQVDAQDFYKEIYRECTIASGNWMMRRDLFMQLNGFSGLNYPEDYDLLFRWYQGKLKIAGVDAVTHHWRDHQFRTSRISKHYSQKYFFQLKVKRFLEIDYGGETLLVNGDGLKGKLVANVLLNERIPFYWVGKASRRIKKGTQTIAIFAPIDLPSLNEPLMLNTTMIEHTKLKELYGSSFIWQKIVQL